jgi:hypothetical protein
VRDVVEGLAHGADESGVAFEHGIEEADHFIEFIVGLSDGNAGVEVARLDDIPGGGDEVADGAMARWAKTVPARGPPGAWRRRR